MKDKKFQMVESLLGDVCTNELMEYLIDHNFFVCPASVNHHGNETGGLFTHSAAVANELISLTKNNNLKWQREESPAIVGLFHDMCKTDDYIMVVENEGC